MNIADIVPDHLRGDIVALQNAGSNGIFFDGMTMAPSTPDSIVQILREAAYAAIHRSGLRGGVPGSHRQPAEYRQR